MKLGLVTDLHFRDAVPGTSPIAKRECRRVGAILTECLADLRTAGVDLVICAGDCVDDPRDERDAADLARLRDAFAASGLPTLVLPGNHDPAPEEFYRVLPHPPRVTRLGDVEVVTFADDPFDHETQLATRPPEVLAWMREAFSASPPGVALTVVVQHCVVFPEYGGAGYRHTYANDAEIRAILEASPRRTLVLSGHAHGGYELATHNGVGYFTARALCEHPYPYYVIHAQGGEARIEACAVAAGTPQPNEASRMGQPSRPE